MDGGESLLAARAHQFLTKVAAVELVVEAAGGAGSPEGLEIGAAEGDVILLAAELVGEGEEGETDGLEGEVGAGGGVVGGMEEEGELLVLLGDGVWVGEGAELEDRVPVGRLAVAVQHLEGGHHLRDAIEVGAQPL